MIKIASKEEYIEKFAVAEQLRATGEIWPALETYRSLMNFFLDQPGWEDAFTINEFRIVDRLPDLSMLTGNVKASTLLLTALFEFSSMHQNNVLRVYVATRLLLLHVDQSEISKAIEIAHQLGD